jgi:hypothetical protein
MNPIIDLIHSVDRVSIIVAWSPNIMIRYFILDSPSAPGWRAHELVGAAGRISTSVRETLGDRGAAVGRSAPQGRARGGRPYGPSPIASAVRAT